jgi:hypothetical protein
MPLFGFIPRAADRNELAHDLKHEGVRAGEIIAYRAWRVMVPSWGERPDYRLHSVYKQEYVWDPEQPASGDVRFHGIYSFKRVITCREQYGYSLSGDRLVFGSVKIWGEIVEHEDGYRSEFARIASLDYGHPELLDRFRPIYGVGKIVTSAAWTSSRFSVE